jgi:hypothetical protein
MHLFSELTSDKTKGLIDQLGRPGLNHDLGKVFIETMAVSLEKAREGLPADRQKQYGDWFRDWEARLQWARGEADGASVLFLGKEAFNPLTLASASKEEAWDSLRKMLERWAWEQRMIGQEILTGILKTPESLPEPLSLHLSANLSAYVQQAVPLVLRRKENGEGWIAWQQRFIESTYFEVRATRADLARRIEGLAREKGAIPALIEKLDTEIREQFARQKDEMNARFDSLEDAMFALRGAIAAGSLAPAADDRTAENPAPYLRKLWDLTQTINLEYFQPPDGKARPFFIERLYTKLTTVIAEEPAGRLQALEKAGRAGDTPLHEAIKSHRLLVLVGDPGSGKTTFLKRIAFELCRPIPHRCTIVHTC